MRGNLILWTKGLSSRKQAWKRMTMKVTTTVIVIIAIIIEII